MLLPAILLLATSVNSVTLFDEVVRVPRSRWSGLNVRLEQRPGVIRAKFQVTRKGDTIRAMVMTREDVARIPGMTQATTDHLMSFLAELTDEDGAEEARPTA